MMPPVEVDGELVFTCLDCGGAWPSIVTYNDHLPTCHGDGGVGFFAPRPGAA